jgi:hypothetical protein
MKRLIPFVMILVLISSCGAPAASPTPQPSAAMSQEADPGRPFQLTVPATLEASPEQAAAAIMDPNRVEQGVWFLLRGLGIGVYTGDGQQILAGSETGPQDFWLYDFEVPLMVRMTQEPSRPFSEFLPLLTELGWKSGLEETLKQYQEGYAANPDAYLVHFFAASGLLFEGDPQITPLQEWLLLLDTFLPPNPTASTGMSAPSRVGLAGAGILSLLDQAISATGLFSRQEQQPCGSIRGGTFIPNWGVANEFLATVDDMIEVGRAYYAIHGPLLARSVTAEMHYNKSIAHEGHGTPGDKITFTLTLGIYYGGLNMTLMPPTCGLLVNNIINLDSPAVSQLRDVQVWWQVSAFTKHGSFQDFRGRPFDYTRPTQTDPSGQTSITFQARQESANGQGELKSVGANLTANYDPRMAIQMLGVTEPRLLMFLVGFTYIRLPGNITLEWHESASYTGEGTYRKSVNSSGVVVTMAYTYSITFHALPDGTIEGTGSLTKTEASNAGQGMFCKDIGTAALSYPPLKVSGTFTPATADQMDGNFQLVIENQPSTNSWQWKCSVSAGGISMDMGTMEEGVDVGPGAMQFELPAKDGAQSNGTKDLSVGGGSGNATWDLIIHKQAIQ